MSEKPSFDVEKKDRILKQLAKQRKKLEEEEKISAIAASCVVLSIAFILSYLILHGVQTATLSTVAFVVEIGTIFLMAILVVQFDSLKREIKSVFPEIGEWTYILNSSIRAGHIKELDIKILGKVYDVNKNTIDKLFEKVKTFSKTWLAVSGGVASTLLIEIFKSEALGPLSALILITCAVLLWSIAQDLYGMLNYELVKKTKDLAYWWIATI